MADRTPIEWTDATWNVINGCSVVSPGCTNCYAMRLAGTRFRNHPTRQGLTTDSKAGPVWNGEVRFNEKVLTDPLRWTRPRRIFVCAHGDLFHENVPDEWIDRVFAVMAMAQQHVFQILTKRPERMRAYVRNFNWARVIESCRGVDGASNLGRHTINDLQRAFGLAERFSYDRDCSATPLPNVWLGVSAEDQARADERIPVLQDTPAAVRWLSAEPLLGPIDLTSIQAPRYVPEDHELDWKFDALSTGDYYQLKDDLGYWEGGDGPDRQHRLDWVVAGGESGPGARPMHPDWARQLRDQCAAAGVPFLFKQWGDWTPVTVEGDPEWETIDQGDPGEFSTLNPRETGLLHRGGRREDDGGFAHGVAEPRQMLRIGKKAAGRRLDGQIHDDFPEGRS